MSGNGIFVDTMFGYVRRYRQALRRRRAERVLNNLPPHMRRDIGWPTGSQFTGDE